MKRLLNRLNRAMEDLAAVAEYLEVQEEIKYFYVIITNILVQCLFVTLVTI
ncbi:hypothetical protein [Nostoc sp. CHAB 5715]|uniref:hypothetical protein n=1 Tax=Nostoc sp. CHAB 5715 TaxID=2780400 RepID=UPI001E38DACD|nr:hypothetical protein [Nostoc sp. CHAB 5715]MCC5626049.1 hypothetical protein [Nostoc sp. CHAB 5715]